jgi:MinD-like ATPase involved in chromosome partitioning or flagellar assembly
VDGVDDGLIYQLIHGVPTMVMLIHLAATGVRLHDYEPPEDGRRGLSRPPWLSVQDAYRGVGIWPPERHVGSDDHDPAFGAGDGAPRDDPPVPRPPVPTSAAEEAPESLDIDPAARQARKSAEIPADLDADVGSNSVSDDAEYRLPGFEPAYGDGYFMRQDPPTGDVDPDDGGRVDADYRTNESDSAPDELKTKQASRDSKRPQEPSAQRMSLPPWKIRASMMPSEFDDMTSEADEPRTARPVARPAPEATGESRPRQQGSGLSPPAAPRPPLPPPPGWPPGAPLPPAWWPPPGTPGWPPFPPGALPPPDWQQLWGDGAQSPPARSHAPIPPEVHRVQTFRKPPSLDEAKVIDPRTYAPRSGWRRAVHRATRGHVNPGDSRKDRAQEDLLSQIRQPILSDFRIAVLSIKGGVGKTTTTLGLGSALAIVRRDRVIAVDANPDRGTLAERVHDISTNSTVRDLLTDPNINRYADVRGHTRMAVSRLEVLASEQDPAAADVFDEADYRRTIGILGHYYNIILTDCGTGIMHSAMAGVLELAHSIVLVSSPAIDAVRSASATLDWLMQHGHSSLVREGHVVLSATRPGSAALKLDRVCEFFEARCQSIHFVPFDPHLSEGAEVDFEMLRPTTRQAYLELAGAVAENFPRLHAGHP